MHARAATPSFMLDVEFGQSTTVAAAVLQEFDLTARARKLVVTKERARTGHRAGANDQLSQT